MNISKHLKNEATISSKNHESKALIWLPEKEFVPIDIVSQDRGKL